MIKIKRHMVLLSCLTILLLVGASIAYLSPAPTEEYKIDKFFESNIFDEARERYGITAVGVGKSERIFHIEARCKNNAKGEEIKSYFTSKLKDFGLHSYQAEVFSTDHFLPSCIVFN